jgi:hypothetical protein
MMVPDFVLIAEIMMFSEGFGAAKALARKMAAIMELSQQQLSKQDHYDYGERAEGRGGIGARVGPRVARGQVLSGGEAVGGDEVQAGPMLTCKIPTTTAACSGLSPRVRSECCTIS